MQKFSGSIVALLMSALLLTSCSDGNQGSEYYSLAKEQAKSAGVKATVIAGKTESGKDFVTLKYKDYITRDDLFKSVEVLSSMEIPAETERRVEWETGKHKGPSMVKFNTPSPDMEVIEKLAKVNDVTEGELNNIFLDLTVSDESKEETPKIVFNVDERLTDEENRKTTEEINDIIG